MNRFGKTLLVATSLTPIFLVCAVNSAITGHWDDVKLYGAIFAILAVICLFIFTVVKSKLPKEDLNTSKVKSADKEVLAFLLSYLLPFFFKGSTVFAGEVVTAATVTLVIGIIIFFSSAYTFNPLLAVVGYRFYEVESDGMTYLLISKQHFRKPSNALIVRHLCEYIYIDENEHE